jgi:hypothetical protein
VRLFLIGGLLSVASTLLNCSSANISSYSSHPAWQVANAPQSREVKEKPIARRQKPKKTQTARPDVSDENITGSTLRRDNDLKPFSKEWYARETGEDERLRRIMNICRGC